MDVVHDLDVTEVLADHRLYRPSQVAVVDGAERLSFGELADRVEALAAALQSSGFRAGDRLLWLGGDSYRLLECLLAVARLGGVICPVDCRRPGADLEVIVGDCAPSVVVGDEDRFRAGRARVRSARDTRWISLDGADGYETLVETYRGRVVAVEPVAGNAPLLMLYTPVLGGRAVGVQVSRGALVNESVTVALRENTGAGHARNVPGPMAQIRTLVTGLAAILVGATMVVASRTPSETVTS